MFKVPFLLVESMNLQINNGHQVLYMVPFVNTCTHMYKHVLVHVYVICPCALWWLLCVDFKHLNLLMLIESIEGAVRNLPLSELILKTVPIEGAVQFSNK